MHPCIEAVPVLDVHRHVLCPREVEALGLEGERSGVALDESDLIREPGAPCQHDRELDECRIEIDPFH